ncbi:unnamed protein product [Amoebophrya sp. A120]|nr:unnamed protein product [Amoebophrya sp. A120]|eukprot:GSA120T00016870001.1
MMASSCAASSSSAKRPAPAPGDAPAPGAATTQTIVIKTIGGYEVQIDVNSDEVRFVKDLYDDKILSHSGLFDPKTQLVPPKDRVWFVKEVFGEAASDNADEQGGAGDRSPEKLQLDHDDTAAGSPDRRDDVRSATSGNVGDNKHSTNTAENGQAAKSGVTGKASSFAELPHDEELVYSSRNQKTPTTVYILLVSMNNPHTDDGKLFGRRTFGVSTFTDAGRTLERMWIATLARTDDYKRGQPSALEDVVLGAYGTRQPAIDNWLYDRTYDEYLNTANCATDQQPLPEIDKRLFELEKKAVRLVLPVESGLTEELSPAHASCLRNNWKIIRRVLALSDDAWLVHGWPVGPKDSNAAPGVRLKTKTRRQAYAERVLAAFLFRPGWVCDLPHYDRKTVPFEQSQLFLEIIEPALKQIEDWPLVDFKQLFVWCFYWEHFSNTYPYVGPFVCFHRLSTDHPNFLLAKTRLTKLFRSIEDSDRVWAQLQEGLAYRLAACHRLLFRIVKNGYVWKFIDFVDAAVADAGFSQDRLATLRAWVDRGEKDVLQKKEEYQEVYDTATRATLGTLRLEAFSKPLDAGTTAPTTADTPSGKKPSTVAMD